jgi:hypothetical protein
MGQRQVRVRVEGHGHTKIRQQKLVGARPVPDWPLDHLRSARIGEDVLVSEVSREGAWGISFP